MLLKQAEELAAKYPNTIPVTLDVGSQEGHLDSLVKDHDLVIRYGRSYGCLVIVLFKDTSSGHTPKSRRGLRDTSSYSGLFVSFLCLFSTLSSPEAFLSVTCTLPEYFLFLLLPHSSWRQILYFYFTTFI